MKSEKNYSQFDRVNGKHPYKSAVPEGFLDYGAKRRHGGRVFYFNFPLAKEMGLIPKGHDEKLNKQLCNKILDTFSIQIINEYDILHNTPIPEKDRLPHQFMATRYLQLQHPDKTGRTSGDGRSIWNGHFSTSKATWDISSCGTGATSLSPATAIEKKYFKTGDNNVSYGCGLADLIDGIYTTIMSEIFHYNDIPTERMLAIIAYDDGSAINVRANKNLLRPAHFFHHVKQGNHDSLKQVVDYYIDREICNKVYKKQKTGKSRYENFLAKIVEDFARATARFESEYIFCWLDWDGDNILMDAGIIDYGSVRQFGLFHHEYRFDDVERYSTTIKEQKNKAKYIVQTFAQIADFLITGKKKPIARFNRCKALADFEKIYVQTLDELYLHKTGLDNSIIKKLLANPVSRKLVQEFRKSCAWFEQVKSSRGTHKVEDGITWDAVFCLRDILRELPAFYLENQADMEPRQFISIIKSHYATSKDTRLTNTRTRKIREFQTLYRQLIKTASKQTGKAESSVLGAVASRSRLINRHDRITGNSIVYISEKLSRARNRITPAEFQSILDEMVFEQILNPENRKLFPHTKPRLHEQAKRLLNSIQHIVQECCYGL